MDRWRGQRRDERVEPLQPQVLRRSLHGQLLRETALARSCRSRSPTKIQRSTVVASTSKCCSETAVTRRNQIFGEVVGRADVGFPSTFTFIPLYPDSEVRALLTQRQNQLNNHFDQNLHTSCTGRITRGTLALYRAYYTQQTSIVQDLGTFRTSRRPPPA